MQIKQELNQSVLTICEMRTSRHEDVITPEEESKRDISTVILQDSEIGHRVSQWREIHGEKKDGGQEISFHPQDLHDIEKAAWAANQKRRLEAQDLGRKQDHMVVHQFLVEHLSDVTSRQDMVPMICMKRRMSSVMKETLKDRIKELEIERALVGVRRRIMMILTN
jgi:hypothetical protein